MQSWDPEKQDLKSLVEQKLTKEIETFLLTRFTFDLIQGKKVFFYIFFTKKYIKIYIKL